MSSFLYIAVQGIAATLALKARLRATGCIKRAKWGRKQGERTFRQGFWGLKSPIPGKKLQKSFVENKQLSSFPAIGPKIAVDKGYYPR